MSLLELIRKAEQAFPGKRIAATHLLLVLAEEEEKELAGILAPSGLTVERFREALSPLSEEPVKEDQDLVTECWKHSKGSPTGWHLLSAILANPGHRITQALVEAGMDLEGLKRGLDRHKPQGGPIERVKEKAAQGSELLKYGRDLTQEAAGGAFDDLSPRPKQLKRLIQILLRKERPNPVLTGPAGVGKTALVELLARELVHGEVPEKLRGTRVFEISMGKLVAGTMYRGQFEARLEAVLKALREAEPAILFIDEFHLVWGAGRAEGAPIDAANILKRELNRGQLRIIGATTSEEYHRYIKRDPALDRRFTELPLEEPSGKLLLEILKGKREGLEEHHGVRIPDAILAKAAELADLHLPNKHQPAKTIDLLDTSAVQAVSRGGEELTEKDLLKTLEDMTGGPLLPPGEETRRQLLELGERLKRKIIGQDEAIDKVVATLIYRRQRLGEAERNMGSFLFIGNTGVGKTELARTLARELFKSEQALLHLDMAEYKGGDGVHKLIGFPTGLPGGEAGVLTGWLYRHGTGVILFDEIEKAHREVHHLLLGMLDRGRIRDARGEELDTRQCVIILTSNALSPEALERYRKRQPLGFGTEEEAESKPDISELLAESFPREFLGRLDEIILFNDLGDEELKGILKLKLREGLSRFELEGVRVEYEEDRLLDHLLDALKRQGKAGGAREVKRLLERTVFQPLALALAGYSGERPVTLVLTDEFYSSGRVVIGPVGGRQVS